MDGLRTARVLVLDDQIEEAKPFMEALAKRGIGATYFSGDAEMLPCPDHKLTGIRLAVLDLDLGVGGEAPAAIGTLLRTVNGIIRHDNGPYLAIVWTDKEEEYFSEFVCRQTEIACQPIQMIKMYKPDYGVPGNVCVDKIFGKVTETVDASYPMGLLSFWEQIIHDSSGSVMDVVSDDNDWVSQSKKALRLLLDATGEAGDASAIQLRALLSSFNSLQLDTIESDISSLQDETVGTLMEPLGATKGSDDVDLKAKLNYRLLRTASNPSTAPGNVYLSETVCPSQNWLFPTLHDLVDEMAERGKEQQLKDAGCVAIALEVTPLCDYRRSRRSRFVCGLALPYHDRRLAKQPTGFLRTDRAPIAFETGLLAGTKLLVWNSRWMVTIPSAMASAQASLFRLRHAPLIDIQSWLAGQQNRPGYLSITTSW